MDEKKLSNPFSTGGGGGHFEAHVQALFVTLMLTGGYAPGLPCWPIVEIKLQGKIDGYQIDDLIVSVENTVSNERCKLLGQVKHSIRITNSDKEFSEVIDSAWKDFNNPKIFTKGKDIIALITGPLSKMDYQNVQWVLNQSRYTKNADEFFRNVKQYNFSPTKANEKLEVIQNHLKQANNNKVISNDELYLFLKHFYLLGYDIGKDSGVVLPLIYSHISQFNQKYPQWVWPYIIDIVQTWNQNGGTLTLENLPDDLKEVFSQTNVALIPIELTVTQTKIDWSKHPQASDLALANLIGAWNENNESDIAILSRITSEDYPVCVSKYRTVLQLSNSPFSLQNGLWKITERASLWDLLGSRIFDDDLVTFKDAVVSVLSEHDPSFELPTEERYMANIHGKVLTYSAQLRKGMAEGLALLGNRSEALIYCTQDKVKAITILSIREILMNADWILWGSLDRLLPTLAEAAPDEFLNAVEHALILEPCPFTELFSQEGDGFTGRNYLTGLLWALEVLAWDEKYLVRVCSILGELATHDSGGQWSNRPANSLSTILLPWTPQTIAPIQKCKIAVQTLCKEFPNIAWKLLIGLLPNEHQVSMGTYKPVWYNVIPEDWTKSVTNNEYLEQISFYAELAITIASYDISKICEFIDHLDNIPKSNFDQFLKILLSDSILGLPEDERLPLWDKLTKFISKHRRFSDAEWAMNEQLLSSIEVVSKKIAPSNLLNFYQHLFSQSDFDLYDENDNWDEQQKKLEERRQKAVKELLNIDGINTIIKFATIVGSPNKVGGALGFVAKENIDSALLPEYLQTESNELYMFISEYVRIRHHINGWAWVDAIKKTDWSVEQLGQFLICLPFINETWIRVDEWLGESQDYYWLKTNAIPYQMKDNFTMAIDKLIENGRPRAAINCLNRMHTIKLSISVEQCVRALLAALSSSEPSDSINVHNIVELIKVLQESPEVIHDDLFRVEWAYLALLNRYSGASPKLLENRLANDPNFFCEVIRLVYRSNKKDAPKTEQNSTTKNIATNAWKLLHQWHTPPGTQEDGCFNEVDFSTWIQRVKTICTDSGHIEVALVKVGEVLIHCPPDKNGLWINDIVASALNARDSADMRSGFQTGTFNSRGVHLVDPTGKPEKTLAEQYRQKAEDVENAGYQRFAVTLRNLSQSYSREAERIIIEHKRSENNE